VKGPGQESANPRGTNLEIQES